jgi:iron(III) transport system permease protein
MPILGNMDGSLEEAGRTSGASSWRTVRRITLPVIWPATLGIIILQVILLMGALEIPLLFGQLLEDGLHLAAEPRLVDRAVLCGI